MVSDDLDFSLYYNLAFEYRFLTEHYEIDRCFPAIFTLQYWSLCRGRKFLEYCF